MKTILTILTFMLGASIGSFLSVVIYRIKHNKKGILTGRSICPNCDNTLKPQYLVPVFSWLFLKGKCGFCGKKISANYFFLEVFTGALFAITFLKFNFITSIDNTVIPNATTDIVDFKALNFFIFYAIEFTLLSAIFFYDKMYTEIPDRLSIPAILIALVGTVTLGILTPLQTIIGAVAISGFFLAQFILSRGRWIGGGDIRLGAIIGAILGWKLGIIALMIAYITGSIAAIALLLQKKSKMKNQIAFGPFLIIGLLVAIFYGEQILNWYLGTMII